MIASSYPAIDNPAMAVQFNINGLRSHPEYAPLALTLHSQLGFVTTVEKIEAELIHAEQSSRFHTHPTIIFPKAHAAPSRQAAIATRNALVAGQASDAHIIHLPPIILTCATHKFGNSNVNTTILQSQHTNLLHVPISKSITRNLPTTFPIHKYSPVYPQK